jgi:hypothetical protein
MSDIIGAITGTSPYETVQIEDQNSRYKITAHYHGSQIVYSVPRERLRVEGIEIELKPDSTVVLESHDEHHLWIKPMEDMVKVTRNEPA